MDRAINGRLVGDDFAVNAELNVPVLGHGLDSCGVRHGSRQGRWGRGLLQRGRQCAGTVGKSGSSAALRRCRHSGAILFSCGDLPTSRDLHVHSCGVWRRGFVHTLIQIANYVERASLAQLFVIVRELFLVGAFQCVG